MPFGSITNTVGPMGPAGPAGPAGPGTFSAEAVVVNAKDYPTIQDAVNATPVRGILYFPKGEYSVSSPIVITKRISLVGAGFCSQLYQSSDNHLIHFDASGVSGGFQYLTIKDLYLGSAATSPGRALLKLSRIHDCHIENVCMLGGYYGLHLHGCLRNTIINLHTDTSSSCFGNCSVNEYYVYSEPMSGVCSNNANVFLGCHIRGGGTGKRGLYIVDNRGEGNFNMIGGTVEGFPDQGIYLLGLTQSFNIMGVHVEGQNSKIEVVDCSVGSISGCYASEGIEIRRSDNIRITGCYVRSVIADKFSSKIYVGNTKLGSGDIYLPGSYSSIENISLASVGNIDKGGLQTQSGRNMVDGDLETWVDGVPIGFTIDVANPPEKTGVGQTDTLKNFGKYAAKITIGSGQTREGLRHSISGDLYRQLAAPDPTNYRSDSYRWTQSVTKPGEYYLELASGGNPSVNAEPLAVFINETPVSKRTLGSLGVNEWGYGDNDGLGYNTIYVRLDNDSDPDTKPNGYIKACHKYRQITASAWFYKPSVSGDNPCIYVRFFGLVDYFVQLYGANVNTGEWTRVIKTIALDPRASEVRISFGMYSSTAGKTVYVDGIEIVEGNGASPNYDDSRGIAGDLRVNGRFITSKVTQFPTGSTTPSVSDGNIFRTNNTSPTTITMFSNGAAGQEIKVIFGDNNTTIDFTGTNLKGNKGVDWTGATGDHLTCVFDGTYWYCNVSDNTL